MGYGKFEYTREGVNLANDIYPISTAGCVRTPLNSPSDSEIHLSPSPQKFHEQCSKRKAKGATGLLKKMTYASLLSASLHRYGS
jgi:hypothetical protein